MIHNTLQKKRRWWWQLDGWKNAPLFVLAMTINQNLAFHWPQLCFAIGINCSLFHVIFDNKSEPISTVVLIKRRVLMRKSRWSISCIIDPPLSKSRQRKNIWPTYQWSRSTLEQSQQQLVLVIIAQAGPRGFKISKDMAFNEEASKCGFVCNFERAVARMLRRGGSWNATHFSQDESH